MLKSKYVILLAVVCLFVTISAKSDVFDLNENQIENSETYIVHHGVCCTHCVIFVGRTSDADARADLAAHARNKHGRGTYNTKVITRHSDHSEPKISSISVCGSSCD